MAFRIERSSRDGSPKPRRSLPGRLQVIVGCSGPRHADSKAGTPRNPGCCKRRLANGCRARPWTDWPPLPRPYAGIESEFYPSGRPPRRGSVGDSSRGASCFLPSAVPQAMLGLQDCRANIQPRTATVPATLPMVVPLCFPTYIIFRAFCYLSLYTVQIREAGITRVLAEKFECETLGYDVISTISVLRFWNSGQLTGEWEATDMARRRKVLPVRQIAAMRYYYSKGHRIVELAEHFGVHESVVSNICHGRTHRRVLPAEDLPPLPVRVTPEEEARSAERIVQLTRKLASRRR